MSRKTRIISILIFSLIIAILLVGIFVVPKSETSHQSIQTLMRDAVLHEGSKINFLGIKNVNPGLISAFVVSAIIFVFAIIVRIFVVPKFKYVPGRFQLILEAAVEMFDNMAKSNSPHRNKFLGAYIFSAGTYIAIGTLFELLGFQAITTNGNAISLPAPLSDINGAIMMGFLSYAIILSGGISANKAKGIRRTLKDFSLPISMSFRIFGAMLSGALVTELMYHYMHLSFILPVIAGVLFTILHAVIQAYVLTMLTALFYGEVSEREDK